MVHLTLPTTIPILASRERPILVATDRSTAERNTVPVLRAALSRYKIQDSQDFRVSFVLAMFLQLLGMALRDDTGPDPGSEPAQA